MNWHSKSSLDEEARFYRQIATMTLDARTKEPKMDISIRPLLKALRDTCALFGALVLANTVIPLGFAVDPKITVAAFVVLAVYEYLMSRRPVPN
jgi:hypothetical protein